MFDIILTITLILNCAVWLFWIWIIFTEKGDWGWLPIAVIILCIWQFAVNFYSGIFPLIERMF